MDFPTTTIPVSNGIKVFGSSLVRVAPDIANIRVAVSRIEQEPQHAFATAHAGAKAVHDYLTSVNITEIGSSRITLSEAHRYEDGKSRFAGYQARLGYSIVLRDLDRVEDVVVGLIAAGANELASVTFETSRLKELREQARTRAVAAARQKAELYAAASGVSVGDVIAIEDINPEVLSRRSEGHVREETLVDDAGDIQAIDPGAITVGGAVSIVYALRAKK